MRSQQFDNQNDLFNIQKSDSESNETKGANAFKQRKSMNSLNFDHLAKGGELLQIDSMRRDINSKSSSFGDKDNSSPQTNNTAQREDSEEDLKETSNEEQTTKVSIEILNGIPIKSGNKKKTKGNALVLHHYKVNISNKKLTEILGILWHSDLSL